MYPRAFFGRRASKTREDGKRPVRKRSLPATLLAVAGVLLFLSASGLLLKNLSTQIAVSDARDAVTMSVSAAVAELMREQEDDAAPYVCFEKNDAGDVTAINSNMPRINALSARILDRVAGQTERQILTVEIPAGNLTGISLLMGRGPAVPVRIIALSSSRVEFSNSVVSAGINQTRHQIILRVIVDIDVLVPWGTESTQAVSEILIADTLIVGRVPETYVGLQP